MPIGAILTLVLLPYIDRNPSTVARRRKVAIVIFSGLLAIAVVLTVIGTFFRGPAGGSSPRGPTGTWSSRRLFMATTRRNFLLRGWKLGGALLAAAAGWTMYESLRPLASAVQRRPRSTWATRAGTPPESATYVPQGRAVRRQHRHRDLRPVAEVPAPRLPRPVLRLVGPVRVPVPRVEVRPRRRVDRGSGAPGHGPLRPHSSSAAPSSPTPRR